MPATRKRDILKPLDYLEILNRNVLCLIQCTYSIVESPLGSSNATSTAAGKDVVSSVTDGTGLVTVCRDKSIEPHILYPNWSIVESESLNRSSSETYNKPQIVCVLSTS